MLFVQTLLAQPIPNQIWNYESLYGFNVLAESCEMRANLGIDSSFIIYGPSLIQIIYLGGSFHLWLMKSDMSHLTALEDFMYNYLVTSLRYKETRIRKYILKYQHIYSILIIEPLWWRCLRVLTVMLNGISWETIR